MEEIHANYKMKDVVLFARLPGVSQHWLSSTRNYSPSVDQLELNVQSTFLLLREFITFPSWRLDELTAFFTILIL